MTTPYGALGGAEAVRTLVDRFYTLMDEWPETYALRQLHPQDLNGARQRLFDFLSGWLGGPALYTEKNGHPRLRMRHMPYAIGLAERDQWMMCMRTALNERVPDPDLRAALIGAFAQILMTQSYRYAGASTVSPLDYASLLFALAIGYFVFAEIPSTSLLIGAPLVILSGVLVAVSDEGAPEAL